MSIGEVLPGHAGALPGLLHLLTFLRFRLSVTDAQFLEENVRCVEDRATSSLDGPAAFEERGQLGWRRDRRLGRVGGERCGVDHAHEPGVGAAGVFTHETVDLGAQVVARVVDGYGELVFAVERDCSDVVFLIVFLLVRCSGFLGRRAVGRLGLLRPWHLHTSEFAFLEEERGVDERVALHPLCGPASIHKSPVRGGAHIELLLELSDFHLAAVDVSPDFAADLVRIPLLRWTLVSMLLTKAVVMVWKKPNGKR